MDRTSFNAILEPLRKYLKITLDADQVDVYYKRLQNVPSGILGKATEILIDDAEIRTFPLLPAFWEAITEAKKIIQGSPNADEEDHEFCQACENRGLILIGNTAYICDCKCGRMKRAILAVPNEAGPKARAEIIKKQLKILPPASPPITGLMEKNKYGFWELNQTEHDKWMAAKRTEIAEIDKRRGASAKKVNAGETAFAGIVSDTVEQLGPGKDQLGREPGEDEPPF